MLKIGYSATHGLGVDDGVSTTYIDKPQKGDTFHVGFTSKKGKGFTVYLYLEVEDIQRVDCLEGKIDLKCEIRNGENQVLDNITLHLDTNWHEFKELEE